jgi:4-diphosphocytidyl-2-C-methyl-D-erythritol kinase
VKQAVPKAGSSRLTIQAPAKINLFLKVLNRRPDGYHAIESMMQKIALFDVLHLAKEGKSIVLSCTDDRIPAGRENLVYRAADAFFHAAGKTPCVRIDLEKNIPVAAGLGGGSSDAAAVLLGLNSLFGAGFGDGHLADIGLKLGADVPFFVQPSSAALTTGIGENLHRCEPLAGYWIVLVNPGFPLSTKWVYENFPLTSCSNPYILAPGRKRPGNISAIPVDLLEVLGNDLEAVSINRYPEIGEIKQELKKTGAVAALMSGSGPTVFGLFPGREEAQIGFARFAGKYGGNVFLTRPYIP